MKRTTVFSILFTLVTVCTGCVLGSIQTMSQIQMRCSVIDAATGRPIPNARIELSFDGANPGSRNIPGQVFTTDASGVCEVSVPKRNIWISGSDAFVGGYLRRLNVTAMGFWRASLSDGIREDTLGATKEHTFRLTKVESSPEEPPPNR